MKRKKEVDPRKKVPKKLVFLTKLANRVAFEMMQSKDNCIMVSTVLNYLLQKLGYRSRVVRITAAWFPVAKKAPGVVLGGDGFGCKRDAAGLGMWWGHCGVLVDEKWLLDPTFDQIPNMNPAAIRLRTTEPMLSTGFHTNGSYVRWHIFYKQTGFLHAGDARRSHWIPIYFGMLRSKQFKKYFPKFV